MRFVLVIFVLVLAALGCDAKTGSSAGMPDVAIYPGAKVISNGENSGIIGANLEVMAPRQDVINFYVKDLGLGADAANGGPLKGKKNGHDITVIVTDAGGGKTAVSITEPK